MGGFVSKVSYSCQTFMTFVSASLVGAFIVIVKLRVIFAKVRLKLYWSPVTSPARGPATDRMLGHESGAGQQEEAGAGDAVIDLGPDIHSATPYHKPRNHLIGFKLT